jgi:hypothetical protein
VSRPANRRDPRTLPPKLRALYEAARRLARIKAERALWGNTLKALAAEGTAAGKPDGSGAKAK